MATVRREETEGVLRLPCDDSSDSFEVTYDSMGGPFREGIRIGIRNDDFNKEVTVMLEKFEARRLRDFLLEMYPTEEPL